MNDDDAIFRAFCEAGSEFLRSALTFAKAEDPEGYADVLEIVEDGRARPQLVVEFQPRVAVSLRLVAADDGRVIGDVFTYTSRPARPEERPN